MFVVLAVTALVFTSAQQRDGPPTLAGTFCAQVNQIMHQNGTAVPGQSQSFNLCMDSVNLNWAQKMSDGSITILNTPDNVLYNIDKRGNCKKQTPQAPAGKFRNMSLEEL